MNQKLKICNKSPHENPSYAKAGDSGMDLRAWISIPEDVNFVSSDYWPLRTVLKPVLGKMPV